MSTQVTLRGRLVRDPEKMFSASGRPLTRFSVVTSRRVKDRESNEWRDDSVTFWECVAFGQLAEHMADSALTKGTAVIVTGNACTEEWEGNGEKRRRMKVTADDVAPSLRWASAKVECERPGGQRAQARDENPWSSDVPF